VSQQHGNTPVIVHSELPAGTFVVESVDWIEQLGQPFRGHVSLLSEKRTIDLRGLLAKDFSIEIQRTRGDHWLRGYVHRIEYLGPRTRLHRYRVELSPALGLMEHTGNCRIFQDKTTREIVELLFQEHGYAADVQWHATQASSKRPYCVQFEESDAHFVQRLLEEDGLYYFFQYGQNDCSMVIVDDVSGHHTSHGRESLVYRETLQTAIDEHLHSYAESQSVGIGTISFNSFDFHKPRVPLHVKQHSTHFSHEFEHYSYPAHYYETDIGQSYARKHMEAEDAARHTVSFSGNCTGLRCGNTFGLTEHPVSSKNIQYLVTSSRLSLQASGFQSGEDSAFRSENQITCLPTSVPYRRKPSLVKPVMRGPQSATVCGQSGEEIWTDEFGRIKVKFPWDRESKGNEKSSCWIRVVQNGTGRAWGSMVLPRIGDEVIVEFLDGDPDRPIVTGRVYNADRRPPEPLPKFQSKTIFRTRSMKDADAEAFHELTFDDEKGNESIYFHSERDFRRVVENNDDLHVGFEKKSPGNQTIAVHNDQSVEIGKGSGSGSQTIKIQKDRSVTLQQGNDSLDVEQGNLSMHVHAGTATIEAATSIVLKCGSSTIRLSPSGIQISGAAVDVKADGSLDLEGALGTLKASGVLAVKGALVQIN
jgi:type VI secretion system secreted protein VgrG